MVVCVFGVFGSVGVFWFWFLFDIIFQIRRTKKNLRSHHEGLWTMVSEILILNLMCLVRLVFVGVCWFLGFLFDLFCSCVCVVFCFAFVFWLFGCVCFCWIRLVSFGSGFLLIGILESFSEIATSFGNFGKFGEFKKFSETELVEVLLGRAPFQTHPKAILVMDYT